MWLITCVPSVLDLFLVSSPSLVDKHEQCAADDISNHYLIYLLYKVRLPKDKPKILLHRSFGSIDIDSLRKGAQELDWSDVTNNASDIDAKIDEFNTDEDDHDPIHAAKMKHAPAPWLYIKK